MADTKISALGDIATLADGDKVPVADASDLTVSKSATMAEIKTYIGALPLAGGTTTGNIVIGDAKAIQYTRPSASHTATGDFVSEVAGANLVFGDACYRGTDGKMEKALADDAALTIPCILMCIATINENDSGLFAKPGSEVHDDSWSLDVGKSVYLSKDTAGAITKTMPTKVTGNQVQYIGEAIAADTITFNPSPIVMEYA